MKLGANGVELQIELLRALLLGGIAFDTPATVTTAAAAVSKGHVFPLFADRDAANAASYSRQGPAGLLFPWLGARARRRLRSHHAWTARSVR